MYVVGWCLFAIFYFSAPDWMFRDSPDYMPPGYYLETNGAEFRPCRNSGYALLWDQGKGTRQEAINRAWRQYRAEEAEKEEHWKRATP